MSLEAWGDESGDDYSHLLDAGWWSADTVKAVCDCIKALAAEPIYEDGKKENGVSVRFLMRLTDLQYNAGLIEKGALTDEAEAALYPELHNSGDAITEPTTRSEPVHGGSI